ncbi:MAG: hypothetical protein H7Y36_06080 [Armatimonadetes bacterium]|nr:hypothetical protein [Akkermansiaceae bacterium]
MEIEIDYTLDTNGFFNQAGSKEAMRAVCDYFEGILADDLARIDQAQWPGNSWIARVRNPATGNVDTFPGKVIPANTYILYAGGRNLNGAGQGGQNFYSASGSGPNSQQWFDLLQSRGEPGALANPPTDAGPWGGSITFSTSRTWNFSQTASVGGGRSDFITIALHEVCHALGMGTEDSWNTYVNGASFTGPKSTASYGGNVPLQSGGRHWRDDGMCTSSTATGYSPSNPLNVLSRAVGQFGVTEGQNQIALLDPVSCRVGSKLKVMTALEVAGLDDVGWEIKTGIITPLPELAISVNQDNGAVTLSWLANPDRVYQVQESGTLQDWVDLGNPVSLRSGPVNFPDGDPPIGRNFYRLHVDPPSSSDVAFALANRSSYYLTVETEPNDVSDCDICADGH